MTTPRGTSNTAIRGSAEARRRRKRTLLARDGDGTTAPCWECGTAVTFETMIVDKIRTGRDGGRYRLKNCRVHCRKCSELQGHRMGLETRRWRAWQKRGLRKTRVSPTGFRTSYRWYIRLDDELQGSVERDASGNWTARRWLLVINEWWPVGGTYRTMREAQYALLVESTTKPRKAAA